MKARVIIEKNEHGYGAFIENLKSTIIGEGKTVEEAKKDLLNSLDEVRHYYAESGRKYPDNLDHLELEYKYDISAFFNAFDFLNASKFAKRIGISPSLMRHYKGGNTYISPAQAKKIEKGLHQIGNELLSVNL
ncbi:MAG: pilus assembly protein HicB [Bacteroidales bacterium]|nr:pilus assembly protein HicB [Bacteroidales bacterium]